jgi:hypothetical protein
MATGDSDRHLSPLPGLTVETGHSRNGAAEMDHMMEATTATPKSHESYCDDASHAILRMERAMTDAERAACREERNDVLARIGMLRDKLQEMRAAR